jgi:hypothetical protein
MLVELMLNTPAMSALSKQVFSAAANLVHIERTRLPLENANVIYSSKKMKNM